MGIDSSVIAVSLTIILVCTHAMGYVAPEDHDGRIIENRSQEGLGPLMNGTNLNSEGPSIPENTTCLGCLQCNSSDIERVNATGETNATSLVGAGFACGKHAGSCCKKCFKCKSDCPRQCLQCYCIGADYKRKKVAEYRCF